MRGAAALFLLLAFPAGSSWAIGYQHGLFRSQATQGPAWIGTASIIEERLVVMVHPDYLDVEMDWEFEIGGSKPALHEKALEIVGNINMEAGTSITGMLVWYQGKILKGKLKTTEHARKEYEEVVDRNSPVPPKPRDPVLIERSVHKDLKDNYDISIFPVEWGGTRKVRIRYVIPANGSDIGFPHGFTKDAKIVLKTAPGLAAFEMRTAGGRRVGYDAPAVELSPSEFKLMAEAWNYLSSGNPQWIRPMQTAQGSTFFMGKVSGKVTAYLADARLRIPADLLQDDKSPPPLQVFATLTNGRDSCRKEVGKSPSDSGQSENLRLWSSEPIAGVIRWEVHSRGTPVRTWLEEPSIQAMEDGAQFARTFGMAPFFPLTGTLPRSLGVVLGFVDDWYSLVALESDTLPDALAIRYAFNGVPALEPEEIHPDEKEVYSVPRDEWLRSRNRNPQELLYRRLQPPMNQFTGIAQAALPAGFRYSVRNGRLELEIDAELFQSGTRIECSVHGLDGRKIRGWNAAELSGGKVSWDPRQEGLRPGAFILNIGVSSKRYSRVVLLAG